MYQPTLIQSFIYFYLFLFIHLCRHTLIEREIANCWPCRIATIFISTLYSRIRLIIISDGYNYILTDILLSYTLSDQRSCCVCCFGCNFSSQLYPYFLAFNLYIYIIFLFDWTTASFQLKLLRIKKINDNSKFYEFYEN